MIMKSLAMAAVATLASVSIAATAQAQTLDVLVLQEDWDADSVERDTRIQRGMLNEFNKTLQMPSFQRYMQRYGLQGMDVYDENALGIGWYDTSRTRRSDEELIRLAQQIPGQSIDAVVLYTLYANAVKDPYTNVALLQGSMFYRVLDVKGGRFLAGDNVELDLAGIPFTDCAAGVQGQRPNASCVQQFVLRHVTPMAQDAANKIAIQLAALMGGGAGSPTPQGGELVLGGGGVQVVTPGAVASAPAAGCGNLPVTYLVRFEGIDGTAMNAIEEFMSSWNCAMSLELEDTGFSGAAYRYKTRADRMRIVRNIRQMGEMMGLVVDPKLNGEREIVVETVGLRTN